MHRRTQYGHQHTPTTSCLSPSSRARRGGARLSQRPHPTTATNSLAGEPRGPSPAVPGSPDDPAFLGVPHPRTWGLPTVAGAGLSSWKRPPMLYTTFFFSPRRAYTPGHPSPPEASPTPRVKLGPSLELPSRLFRPLPSRPPPAARP